MMDPKAVMTRCGRMEGWKDGAEDGASANNEVGDDGQGTHVAALG